MKFTPAKIEGAWIVEQQRHVDDRGFFARSWCQAEFTDHGLNPDLVQCNVSFNRNRGTVRGMHFQTAPFEEAKLVRCTSGAIQDVIVDLRPDSRTYLNTFSVLIDAAEGNALYVPEGCAHGFQTLEDDTEVLYQMTREYHAESARGFRWNDSAVRIEWPLSISVISEKDLVFPDLVLQRAVA
ncbi:MAG: dTDP-4-dehydrorhamnose 3,5-epimerase [Fuerstiella sp.]|nr:dTDP-4-dehydrorhamnose 3,5-epimerase [Fuerstiella sp.]MDG2126610.1 dTDP-4-dehydrorhamnose 3,5-epimerase [Fuerstiella sp.]